MCKVQFPRHSERNLGGGERECVCVLFLREEEERNKRRRRRNEAAKNSALTETSNFQIKIRQRASSVSIPFSRER